MRFSRGRSAAELKIQPYGPSAGSLSLIYLGFLLAILTLKTYSTRP